ncbi:MAG: ImmA/IrrE family metallo-endopeptidase [Phycisphaerales bacterium]|jgi:Zn-dependent peptidase ImmA (M78 family)|nr:ImmA/IrrE family metallo-endopeptidase [Phycisphaerales bacterium]
MITKSQALACCTQHFPDGPEELAKRLDIPIIRAAFKGSEGWCLRYREQAKITLNSTSPNTRQRFTLAHELAHIVLGTKNDVLPAGAGAFCADTIEEKQANSLAAKFLLPKAELQRFATSLPVDIVDLEKIAKKANVSSLMAARRVAELAHDIGLINGAIVLFQKNQYRWQWSPTLEFPSKDAVLQIWQQAKEASPQLYREKQDDRSVICASYLPGGDFTAMFVQLLPQNVAAKPTTGEQLRDLEAWLFGDDLKFQRSLAGRFGYFSDRKACGMSPEDAAEAFLEHYHKTWPSQWASKIADPRALEWLRLKFRKKG